MKRNKNGFIFMETVIVVGVLSLTLLLLFTSYQFILRKSKERNNFNTTESVYKAYYIKQIIDSVAPETHSYSNNVNWYVHNNTECSPIVSGSKSYVCNLSASDYKGNLLQVAIAYSVEKIYYIDYTELNTKSSSWLNTFDATTIDYLKTLGKRNKDIMVVKLNKYFNNSESRSEILHTSIEL